MKKAISFHILPPLLLVCINLALSQVVNSAPLYTSSRWIVNEDGKRVKLACVNWPSHLEPVLAEGLHKKPVDFISKKIRSMGFNCVRFTWPGSLAYKSMTVENSFKSLGIHGLIPGLKANNPDFLNLSVIEAFQKVVSNLGDNNVMVILDNHISVPGWCCSDGDGSGFFGDEDFNPQLWIMGLAQMAATFRGAKNVIGLSLRNELRGARQNESVWYRYMQAGAEAVHKANPDVLVIVSGLKYAKDLSFLKKRPLKVSFTRKLVFEEHWYSFSDGSAWSLKNANDFCGSMTSDTYDKFGFLLDKGYPVFLSEFGADQTGGHMADNRFMNCMLPRIAEWDLDWGLWALQGGYYKRQGRIEAGESFGILNSDWSEAKNYTFLRRIQAIQPALQGPGVSVGRPHTKIFHPLSGFCIQENSKDIWLGLCNETQGWAYNADKTIRLAGKEICLQASEVGLRPVLGNGCSGPSSKWETISRSKFHLSTRLSDGKIVCLDVDQSGGLKTNPCKCLEKDPICDPASQWFKMIKRE
ncbi:cellulase [Ranunculus cassubicifolius]